MPWDTAGGSDIRRKSWTRPGATLGGHAPPTYGETAGVLHLQLRRATLPASTETNRPRVWVPSTFILVSVTIIARCRPRQVQIRALLAVLLGGQARVQPFKRGSLGSRFPILEHVHREVFGGGFIPVLVIDHAVTFLAQPNTVHSRAACFDIDGILKPRPPKCGCSDVRRSAHAFGLFQILGWTRGEPLAGRV